jgi:predicted acyltransferase
MTSERIYSIDIMRGFTLLLMLFVNDLNMEVAPSWLGHMEADFDGMGLADWVFPIPFHRRDGNTFAFSRRVAKGELFADMSRHILIRSLQPDNNRVLMLIPEGLIPN